MQRKNKKIQTAKGMHDILPPEGERILAFFDIAKELAQNFGFNYIETPIIEEADLFIRTVGKETDIVNKEMFYLQGKKYVLRPEGTAPVVRAYIENGLFTLPQPQRFFYFGKMFRKEKPQKLRFREHHQFGVEILGSEDPFYDVFIINFFSELFKKIKLNVTFFVNSIGCSSCRNKIKDKIKLFYKSYVSNLCEDCKRRYKLNPLRLLDCKKDVEIAKSAPEIVDFLCDDCKEHFENVLDYLDESKISYQIQNNIVRGLDYYNRTVFEIFVENEELALGGGGRYDDLSLFLGKKKIGGVGGAIGVERILSLWQNYKKEENAIGIVTIGFQARNYMLKVINEVVNNGFRVIDAFGKGSLKQQLDYINSLKLKYCLLAGEVEVKEEKVIFKNFENGIQEEIYLKFLIKELKRKIK